jgi:hypothetical protein
VPGQQATGPPDGFNVIVDGELAWVQEHLRRSGQPVFPPEVVNSLRSLTPVHQLQCVARLREAGRHDPGRRLYRRIRAFLHMYETGEAPDESDTETMPESGAVDQGATAVERSAAASGPPAEPTPPQRPCPRQPPCPSEHEPPRRRARVEVVAGSPTYLTIQTERYRTCCPGCGVRADHHVVAWNAGHGLYNAIYATECWECHASWTLTTAPAAMPGGAALFVSMPYVPVQWPANVQPGPGMPPRGRQVRMPVCTRCGGFWHERDVVDLPGRLTVGVWDCPACQVQVSGTMYYDRPWMYFAGYISRRPDQPSPPGTQSQAHPAGTVGPGLHSGGGGQ